jgi:sugar phosphate isomerase/epimerase
MKPLCLATVLCLSFFSSSGAENNKPVGTGDFFKGPLGIQMYSLRHISATNPIAALDKVREYGFHTIEGSPGRIPPAEYLQLLKERNIRLVSTFADYARLKTNIESVIAGAKQLGVKYVVCGWIPHEKGNFSKKNALDAVELFNTVGERLKQAGLIFAFHIHGYEFQPCTTGTMFDLMMQHTKPAFVSYELDVFWAAQGGADPAALFEKYGSRFKLMHVKDLRKGAEINLTGSAPDSDSVPVGQGQINWPAVLKAAQAAQVQLYFIEDEAVDAVNQVPVTLRYLEQLRW